VRGARPAANMGAVRIFSSWPLVVLLALTVSGPHLGPPDPIPAPLAHSALLTLDGAVAPGAVLLRVRANSATAPVTVSDLEVVLDGKALPVTARADGSWRVPLPAESMAGPGKLEVRVTHDGVTEILAAQIPLASAAAPTASPGVLAGAHKQIVWWVLNIAIVLVAALVISRRTS
jgi:hypothetical protein